MGARKLSTSRLREALSRRENRRCGDESGLEGRDTTDGNHNSVNNLAVEAAKGPCLLTLDRDRSCPPKITSDYLDRRWISRPGIRACVVTNCYVAYLALGRDVCVTY